MAAHAIWKGTIELGELRLPIKLHSAVSDHDVHFHLLHAEDGVRVQQRIVNPESGQVVPSAEVVKGYAYEPGSLVVLEDAELEALVPEASRSIELTRFVPEDALHPRWYERPYFLAPELHADTYFALAKALARTGRQGIVRWVMRKRHCVGVLRAHAGHLVLITLRPAEEVQDAAKLRVPELKVGDQRETKLAENLIEALSGELDMRAFKDEYRERLLEFLEAKSKGKVVSLRGRRRAKKEPESLANALRASLEHVSHGAAARGTRRKQQASA